MRRHGLLLLLALPICAAVFAQAPQQPDWNAIEKETMQHFQALLRLDTIDPPGNERPAAEYLRQVLEKEGIPAKVFALEPNRPALLRG